MAVFTPVTLEEVKAWLDSNYEIGQAIELKGINSGIENSNFFLTVKKDNQIYEYVLTLFERLSPIQLPYYLNLMGHLAQKNIPVPAPLKNNQGEVLSSLNGKPATIVTRLSGNSKLDPKKEHCEIVGAMLARMHLAGKDFHMHQANLRSLPWWRETIPSIKPHLNLAQIELIDSELKAQIAFFDSQDYQALPEGPSHCDLFRDNVLFDKENASDKLGGFFDFYFAGTDKWLFDLAVTVNDWCIDLPTGSLDNIRYAAMLNSYQSIRAFEPAEIKSWQLMLRAAALRFWVSRLWDFYLPRDAQMLTPHDPKHFERILIERRLATPDIPSTQKS
jgi:homoserine kinase type II